VALIKKDDGVSLDDLKTFLHEVKSADRQKPDHLFRPCANRRVAHSSVTICAAVLFAQFSQQPMLTPNVSSNFDDRPNGRILRPPALFMFYDFAPHGNGANNRRPPAAVHERLALCLLFVSECVIPGVLKSALFGA
jgi:hypothetical protein